MMRALLMLALLLTASAGRAEPILADLSIRAIDITATFRGTQVLLFGARTEPGDIAVVVRGPSKDYVVRKKERVAGIWVNNHNEKFFDIPGFYAIAASDDLDEFENQPLLESYHVGGHFTDPTRYPGSHNLREFWNAFVRDRQRHSLYPVEVEPIRFWGESLFRTVLTFPKNIPGGTYIAEVYLFRDGDLVALQSTPIEVEKVGFEAFMYRLAHEYAVLYGLLCIGLAYVAGWVASHFFRKA